MTTAARGPKAGGGGTQFTSGTTILNDEVDTDFNNIITVLNGNIDDTNLVSTADIAQTKLADHGTQATATSPGTPDAPSTPTTLAGDIERLRYALAQLKFGNATDQGGELEWFERSPNLMSGVLNLLKNSSFADLQVSGTAAPPADWTVTATAPTYTHTALVAGNGLGLGHYLKITGGAAANTGMTQTIPAAALRPSTTYLFYAMAWATAANTARVFTTGAGTEMDVETTSTTPQLLQGFFTTTADPAAVVLSVVSKASSDVSNWMFALCVPMIATPRSQGYTTAFLQLEGTGTSISGTASAPLALGSTTLTNYINVDNTTSLLRRNITVPGPGYILKVTARVTLSPSANAAGLGHFVLVESTDNEVTYTVRDCVTFQIDANTAWGSSTTLQFVASATPGSKYWFKVMGARGTGTGATNLIPQETGIVGSSFLLVELLPTGR